MTFLNALDTIQGVPRSRVVDVMVSVLLGLDRSMNGLRRHAFTEGLSGPVRLGRLGQPIWRVRLQTGTPSARRLHYTTDDHGNIVFLAIGTHDKGLS